LLNKQLFKLMVAVSLASASALIPASPASANARESGGGVTPSVSGSEGAGYEVQISVAAESAEPGGRVP